MKSSNFSELKKTLVGIWNMFIFKREYINCVYWPMYHYTILKCVQSIYEFIGGNEIESVCFDYLAIDNLDITKKIHDFIKEQEPSATEIIEYVKKPFEKPNSVNSPSEDYKVVLSSVLSCYFLFAAVYLKKHATDKIDNNQIIYLPIEQECTLNYFVHRYINQDEVCQCPEPHDNKKYYYKINEIVCGKAQTDSEMISTIYSHSNTRNKNKKKIANRHLIIGENESYSQASLDEIILLLLNLDIQDIRVQKMVESPSSETMPFLGYSALNEKMALVSEAIYNYISSQDLFLINSIFFAGYFQVFQILRLLDEFTDSLKNNGKEYFDKYLTILKKYSSKITSESICDIIKAKYQDDDDDEINDPFVQLLFSTILLKFSSYIKEKTTVLKYIIKNKSALSPTVSVEHSHRDIIFYNRKDIIEFLSRSDNDVPKLSDKELNDCIDTVFKIYCQLWGQPYQVDGLDYLACYQVVKAIKSNKYKRFKSLNFYKRRNQNDIFKETYHIESQDAEHLSAKLTHEKFTTEDCMIFKTLIDTQKHCLNNIDIFLVYQESIKILDVLEYALSSPDFKYATSPFKHLKAGTAITEEWSKMIPDIIELLRTFGKNINGISDEDIENMRK